MSGINLDKIQDSNVTGNYERSPLQRIREQAKGKKRGPKAKYEATKVTFMLETLLDEALDDFCFNERVSKSQLVRSLLYQFLRQKGYRIFEEEKEKDS